ncbi:PucR family transcriptional regulator [Microbacterium maritypicum]|uniref:PucR family transcriptional regulator n=1 Tax=Microbacterium maritypicum TaxID=33918 RepID=UPI001B31B61B|nr:helix-turn-helix domain-containing protein [Microbacterium liquefaciens]
MVRLLSRETGAFIVVESPRGTPVASCPPVETPGDAELSEFSIQHAGREIGLIRYTAWLSTGLVDLAASIFAHPLLRDGDLELENQRLFGSVLQGVLAGKTNARDLRAHLRSKGIDPDEPISVVAVRVDGVADRRVDFSCEHEPAVPCAIAILDSRRLLVMQSLVDPIAHARRLHARLEGVAPGLCRLGIGEAPQGAIDLRTALAEAQLAMSRGIGVNERAPLTLDRMLGTLPTSALQEYAWSLLNPVVRHDREHNSELIKTLRRLVEEDFSTARTAKALYVHLNTVKYRAAKIADLTGLEISRLDARAQLWIAVTLLDQSDVPPTP